MTTLILFGTAILCACDSLTTDEHGRIVAVINGKPDGIYPADAQTVSGVTLPMPWPGTGYTYANGVFTALPFVDRRAVPVSVTPRQARLALLQEGLLTTVNNAVAAADQATQLTWDYATEVRRDNPLLAAIAAGLDPPLTSTDLDNLFILAGSIT